LFDASDVIGVRSPRRMPHVSELARATQRTLGAAADPDLGLLRRYRLRRRVLERPALAVEARLPVPQRTHQADRLVRATAAALELDAHEVVFVLVPAHPHAEREPAVRELLQRRRLLRQVHGTVERYEHDRGSQADALRPAGDPT